MSLARISFALCSSLMIGVVVAPSAMAQASGDDIKALRGELEALRAQQQQTNDKINQIEAALNRVAGVPEGATSSPTQTAMAPKPTPIFSGSGGDGDARLDISGDFRVRYESNFSRGRANDRDRTVLRGRLRATYAVTDWLTAGGQLATGDFDDPKNVDITLGNFDNKLRVSLDQAYLRANSGNVEIYAGKIPQTYVNTDLVWAPDFNPQGFSASYKAQLGDAASLKATALYHIVDEAVSGPDSRMIGGQVTLEAAPTSQLSVQLSGSYYDYTLRSTAGGGPNDFRSNAFSNGRYLSDFNLLDVIGSVTFAGLGERWPVRVVADYVYNFGAINSDDTGFAADIVFGRTANPGEFSFGGGYAVAETEAVFAAFSQDNITLATNYRQYSGYIDYAIKSNLFLNATLYHYRVKDRIAGGIAPNPWLNRFRINLVAKF
jgi:Putative porin